MYISNNLDPKGSENTRIIWNTMKNGNALKNHRTALNTSCSEDKLTSEKIPCKIGNQPWYEYNRPGFIESFHEQRWSMKHCLTLLADLYSEQPRTNVFLATIEKIVEQEISQ